MDGRFAFDGHTLEVTVTEDVPPLAEQFTPWLQGEAPYEDTADSHLYFYTFTLDGRVIWRATHDVPSVCAGGGGLTWPLALRDGDLVVLVYEAVRQDCHGTSWAYGFSPVFDLAAE